MKKTEQTLLEVRSFIKRRLKEKKMSYADLSRQLKVSEVTVKRWMSNQEPRLSDLEKIGKALGFSVRSPISFQSLRTPMEQTYTLEQEKYFVAKPSAALLFLKLLVGHTFEEALSSSRLSKKQAFTYLKEMEKLGILEQLPGDTVLVKLKGPFKWIQDGPMMTHYLNVFREVINENVGKMNPTFNDSERHGSHGFYRAFETYMQASTAQKFSEELRALFLHYRTIANLEYHNCLDVVPIAGILCMDTFDAWTEVFSAQEKQLTNR